MKLIYKKTNFIKHAYILLYYIVIHEDRNFKPLVGIKFIVWTLTSFFEEIEH